MKYVVFIGSDGLPVPEALAVMQRELPAWIEEMDGRGVRLLGRELDLPQTGVTVRVRGGETLVSEAVRGDQGVRGGSGHLRMCQPRRGN